MSVQTAFHVHMHVDRGHPEGHMSTPSARTQHTQHAVMWRTQRRVQHRNPTLEHVHRALNAFGPPSKRLLCA